MRVLNTLGRPVRQATFAAGQVGLEQLLSGLANRLYVIELVAPVGQPTRMQLVQ